MPRWVICRRSRLARSLWTAYWAESAVRAIPQTDGAGATLLRPGTVDRIQAIGASTICHTVPDRVRACY